MGKPSNETPPPSSPVNLLVIVPLLIVVTVVVLAIKCNAWCPRICARFSVKSKTSLHRTRKRNKSDPPGPFDDKGTVTVPERAV